MQCASCDSPKISIRGRLACLHCERMRLVPKNDAVRRLGNLARRAEKKLTHRMSRYARDDILTEAFKKREQIAREYLFNCKPMDMRMLLGCSAAIKKFGLAKMALGCRRADPARILDYIQKLGNMLHRLEKVPDLEAGTYNLIHMKKYSLNALVSADSGDFPLYPNEKHVQAFVARSGLGMITQSQAERRAAGPSGGVSPAAFGTKKLFTVEETIRAQYYHAYMFADMFFGTPVRKKYGAPPDLDRITILPFKLKKFVSQFPCDVDAITVCGAGRFEALASKAFGGACRSFERDFVMSSDNTGAFPLFLKIGDRVYISQFFAEFYSSALLTAVHRNELGRETMRRSRLYESEVVPAYFKKNGYKYHADQGVRNTLQIDGIAVLPNAAYVVEAKYWNPRKFLGGAGRYRAYDDMIRGSIDGTHFERSSKKWERDGRPLAAKAEWVENNRGRYDIPDGTAVKCMLVTNVHPTAREYNGCVIIYVGDPDALDAQDDAGGLAGAETPRGPAPAGGATCP